NFRRLSAQTLEALSHATGEIRWNIEAHAAGAKQIAPETVATELESQIEKLAAQPAEIGRGGKKCNVGAECAEVADVIGEALQLQRNAANDAGPQADLRAGKRFQRGAVSQRVSDGRIAGDGLGDNGGPGGIPMQEERLGAAMLIAEHDLEV